MNRKVEFNEKFLPRRPYLCIQWCGEYFTKGEVYIADERGGLRSSKHFVYIYSAVAGEWEEVRDQVSLEDLI